MMKIGIDLDGVVVDTYREVVDFYNDYYATDYTYEDFPPHTKVVKYLQEYYGLAKDQAVVLWTKHMKKVFENAKPISNAINIINQLAKSYDIYYISARPNVKGIEEITKEWLQKYNLPNINQLYINQYSKLKMINKLGIDVFIEDAPHQFTELADADIKVIVLKTSYNRNIIHRNCEYENTWEEIAFKIDNMEVLT